MSEHSEDNTELPKNYIAPIRRFQDYMDDAGSYYDLCNGFSKCMSSTLDISEELAMTFIARESSSTLPDSVLYESQPEMAREQMQLGLLRVVMPLLIDLGIEHDTYKDWLDHAIPVAIDAHSEQHRVDNCTKPSPYPGIDLACSTSPNCPVKVVRHMLVSDVIQPTFEEIGFDGPWLEESFMREKKALALIKLEACKNWEMIQPTEAALLRSGYLTKYRNRTLGQPKSEEI